MSELTEQEQWKMDKWGKFSASEIHKLDVPGKKDKLTGNQEMFGQGAVTYIKKIARQAYTMFNERDDFESLAMKNGKIDESQAFGHLFKLIGLSELEYYGGANPIFKHYCKDSGASPDVLAPKDGSISFGADLKCPTGDTHFDYLETIKTHEDLKSQCPEYWCQQQFSMMSFKCNLWLFCSYNEYFPVNDKMLIIEVPRDDGWCANMDIKLKQAVKLKWQEVENRKNRNKFEK